jgi:hypothetical protein
MVEIKHNSKLPDNDDFILAHQAEHVYYLKYPCEKLAAWRVVYKVNPRERLYTPMMLPIISMMNRLMRSYKKKNCQPLLLSSLV